MPLSPEVIHQLLAYGETLWPRTFKAPTDRDTLAVTDRVWMDVLGDLAGEDVRAAMVSWADHWPPTPQELREATLRAIRRRDGDPEPPDPDEAFAELMQAVKVGGYTRAPVWSHPALGVAVEALGGWVEGVCMSENLPALRAHFRQVYEHASARALRESTPAAPVLQRHQNPRGEVERATFELERGDDDAR
jgi:hypothetical protein